MKSISIPAIVIAASAFAGVLPARADLAPTSPRPAAQIELAETDPAPADRASTTQKARAEVQEWRIKLDRFNESAKAHSREAWTSASEGLDAAWIKTREASARLEAATAADWNSAKASYKQASDELAVEWTKVRAEKK